MSHSSPPLISVIIPVFNGEAILKDCLEAIMNLDYPKSQLEVIVVDNNSSDKSADIIRSYPVKYLLEDEVQSSYAARNRGVRLASGEILAFTDSDCIVDKNWINAALPAFEEGRIGAVAGEIKTYPSPVFFEQCLERLKFMNASICLTYPVLPFIQTANAFYRRQVIQEIGLFDSSFTNGGDIDLAWRMQLETSYQIAYRPESFVWHKQRSNFRAFCRQKEKHGLGSLDAKWKNQPLLVSRGFAAGIHHSISYYWLHTAKRFVVHSVKSVGRLLSFQFKGFLAEWINFVGDIYYLKGFLTRRKEKQQENYL